MKKITMKTYDWYGDMGDLHDRLNGFSYYGPFIKLGYRDYWDILDRFWHSYRETVFNYTIGPRL